MDSIKCTSVTKYQCNSVTKYQKYTMNNIVLFIGTDESLVALCDKAMAINKEMMK